MRYCTRCIIPDTRPHIGFDADGVCNACLAQASKPHIDWGCGNAPSAKSWRTPKRAARVTIV